MPVRHQHGLNQAMLTLPTSTLFHGHAPINIRDLLYFNHRPGIKQNHPNNITNRTAEAKEHAKKQKIFNNKIPCQKKIVQDMYWR